MSRHIAILTLLTLALGLSAASFNPIEDEETSKHERMLQDECVRELFPHPRTLEDGAECSNAGTNGCEYFVSDCINYCAHETCQADECESDEDCAQYGGNYSCQTYSYNDEDFGKWCEEGESCSAHTFCDDVICCSYICVDGQQQQDRCW